MIKTIEHKVDFCVVGGGLAGMCAAIAAARQGASVVLMHERPVLGGNASSEIRMWACGAQGKGDRETGIIEEINLENLYRNPNKSFAVWDSILYEKVRFQPNLTLLLNCSCLNAEMNGNKIVSVTGWQLTTQQYHKVYAKSFSDCSGDSILVPLTGASFRLGRESKEEFSENILTQKSDHKTMGLSCLISARKNDYPTEYKAPLWAKKLTEKELLYRRPSLNSSYENFWYLELGGEQDTIGDTEIIRDELLSLAYGMWDYIKNSGHYPDAEYWQLDFVGFLPGKRESRRMMGKYIMTLNDVMGEKRFDDTVAYGGWPFDDHDPKGFYHADRPTLSYPTPSPYDIPYRVLYSENIENLFFAGRNISMTHAAMSSARVMATCAILGQAVGTAASLAAKYDTTPDGIYKEHIEELRDILMYNDCFLPKVYRKVPTLTKKAKLTLSFDSDAENLRNGIDRNHRFYGESENGCIFTMGASAAYSFDNAERVEKVRLIFDSDLERITLEGDECERYHSMRCNVLGKDDPVMHMPKTLVKEYLLEAVTADGKTVEIKRETENKYRFVEIPVSDDVISVKLTVLSTWENSEARVFSFEVY